MGASVTRASFRDNPSAGVGSLAMVVLRIGPKEVGVTSNQQDAIRSLGYDVFVNEPPPQYGVLPTVSRGCFLPWPAR